MTETSHVQGTGGRPHSGGWIVKLSGRQHRAAGAQSTGDEDLSAGEHYGWKQLARRGHAAGESPSSRTGGIEFGRREEIAVVVDSAGGEDLSGGQSRLGIEFARRLHGAVTYPLALDLRVKRLDADEHERECEYGTRNFLHGYSSVQLSFALPGTHRCDPKRCVTLALSW